MSCDAIPPENYSANDSFNETLKNYKTNIKWYNNLWISIAVIFLICITAEASHIYQYSIYLISNERDWNIIFLFEFWHQKFYRKKEIKLNGHRMHKTIFWFYMKVAETCIENVNIVSSSRKINQILTSSNL